MGHSHLHRRGERAPLMERDEVHEHQARSPQFWEDVGDAWNRFVGKDEEDEEPTSTKARSTAPATIVRTVYQTLTPTFSGSVGGYRTVSDSDDEDKKPSSTKKASETTTYAAGGPVLGTARPTTTAEEDETTTEKIPSVISEPTKSKIESTLAVATSTPSAVLDSTGAINADRVDASISSASSTSVATTESAESGPSTGAKAGIAIGVLAGFLFIGLIAFWLFNRRKKQMEQDQNARDDEKLNPFGNPALVTAAAVPSSNSQRSGPAPRLSLRPVTQFLPNLSLDKRNSKGAQVMLASGPSGGDDRLAPHHAQQNSWERPNTSDSTNPSNPFGNQAERIPTPIMEEPESPHYPSEKPLPAGPTTMAAVPSASPAHDTNAMGMAAGVAVGAAAGAVAAGALTRKASIRQDGGPKPLDLTLPPPPIVGAMAGPPSPAGTEFSETSQAGETSPTSEQSAPSSAGAAAIAAAGGPANSMVHRVTLDFKPTMDDELELRTGQVVRLLHEYDDGWALCIRLDRSQQGVVPRTCLSTRPLKARPQNGPGPGPNGAGPNGPGPRNHPGRPNGPGGPGGPPRGPGPKFGPGQRPPQGGPHGGPHGGPQYARGPDPAMMHGRPASPGGRAMSPGPRSQSPGPRFQGPPGGRPQSPSGMGPRSQSPGPRFQGPPGGRARSPSMGPRSQSPAGQSRIPQPSRMGPGGSPPQGSPISPINGRNRALSNASNASGPPTGPVTRKPVPGSAY